MGRQIIAQPDGKWCVWSSGTDSLVWWDFTTEELIEEHVKRAATAERERVIQLLEEICNPDHPTNPRPYFQFTRTFAEAYGEHLGRGNEPLDFETPMPDWVIAAVEKERAEHAAWLAEQE